MYLWDKLTGSFDLIVDFILQVVEQLHSLEANIHAVVVASTDITVIQWLNGLVPLSIAAKDGFLLRLRELQNVVSRWLLSLLEKRGDLCWQIVVQLGESVLQVDAVSAINMFQALMNVE